ncbi:MAG: aldehyde dehydrogenase family protein [Actinomycetota bacterium]|nr:aldehyde dehydrogenase family protein [Actinomycetota bacterium]
MAANEAKKTTRKKTTRTTRSKSKKNTPQTLQSLNPRTGEVVQEFPAASPADVKDAVELARKVAPEWGAIPPEGRARVLKQVRYRIYDLMDEIVETVSRETGKPRSEALAHDVVPAILMCLYYERTVDKALGPQKIGRLMGPLAGASSRLEWRPFGVVGCISPWNYPITNAFLAFSTPLFAGNAIVVKPSEVTPACGELLKKIFEPLPAGIATVVQGAGDVGAALVDAPCDKISFVGSPATGRRICEAAAKHLTPVVMELGGQDAAIVCEDADLDIAAAGVLWGSFFNSGQTCCSIERTFVVDSVADEFKEKLLAKLPQLRVGGEGSEVGPLTFKRQLEIVERHVGDAVGKGATLLAGGPEEGPRNSNGSLWFAPTVLEDVTEEMDVVREETFGPVLTITRVQDDDEAIRRANEEGVNLTASIWTKNRQRATSLGTRLRAGTIASNDHGVQVGMPWSPWGGVGESGFGRLNGKLGLQEFSVPTHVVHNLMPGLKKLWWYPYSENTDGFFRSLAGVLGARGAGSKVSALKEMAKYGSRALKEKL